VYTLSYIKELLLRLANLKEKNAEISIGGINEISIKR